LFVVQGGSIFVDFTRDLNDGLQGEQTLTDPDHPRRRESGSTPRSPRLCIKKSNVAMMSEVEIFFNRTKAWQHCAK